MIKSLKQDIAKQLVVKLDEIYNHRKSKEGLCSAHNACCGDIEKLIADWANKDEWVDNVDL